jgi:hypothetical protein
MKSGAEDAPPPPPPPKKSLFCKLCDLLTFVDEGEKSRQEETAAQGDPAKLAEIYSKRRNSVPKQALEALEVGTSIAGTSVTGPASVGGILVPVVDAVKDEIKEKVKKVIQEEVGNISSQTQGGNPELTPKNNLLAPNNFTASSLYSTIPIIIEQSNIRNIFVSYTTYLGYGGKITNAPIIFLKGTFQDVVLEPFQIRKFADNSLVTYGAPNLSNDLLNYPSLNSTLLDGGVIPVNYLQELIYSNPFWDSFHTLSIDSQQISYAKISEVNLKNNSLSGEFFSFTSPFTSFEQFDAQRKQCPEPSTVLGLLALGTLGAGATLKRKLKTSKSAEKELGKIY